MGRKKTEKTLICLVCSSVILFGCNDSENDPSIQDSLFVLNDTGMTQYTNTLDEPRTLYDEEPMDFPGQDASFGRDVTDNSDHDGRLGFSFTKLDSSGQPLRDQNVSYSQQPWPCVKDNVTGLIWEIKTLDGSYRSANQYYVWANTDSTTNGGFAGFDRDSNCGLVHCNTEAYVRAVNEMGLCGYDDWRVPAVEELRSIIDYSIYYSVVTETNVKIDIRYFPTVGSGMYWSADTAAFDPISATAVEFWAGFEWVTPKDNIIGRVMLVRTSEI